MVGIIHRRTIALLLMRMSNLVVLSKVQKHDPIGPNGEIIPERDCSYYETAALQEESAPRRADNSLPRDDLYTGDEMYGGSNGDKTTASCEDAGCSSWSINREGLRQRGSAGTSQAVTGEDEAQSSSVSQRFSGKGAHVGEEEIANRPDLGPWMCLLTCKSTKERIEAIWGNPRSSDLR